MARLNAKARKAIPTSQFALPGRRFPINDANHARAALSMAHNASPAEQTIIKRRAYAKLGKRPRGADNEMKGQ